MSDTAITARFGGNTTDLRRATDEAEVIVKGFSTAAGRAVGEIGAGLGGAVAIQETIRAVRELGDAAEKASEQELELSKNGAVSDQAQAWLDLRSNASGFWSDVKLGATEGIAYFLNFGETAHSVMLSLAGVSEDDQNLMERIGNQAEAAIEKAKAASDKYLAELPAKQAAATAKLKSLDEEYTAGQIEGRESVNDLTDKENVILSQIVATNKEIDSQESEGLNTDAARYQLSLQTNALMENEIAQQKSKLQATQDEVKSATEKLNTDKQSETVEDQITALKAQQAKYASEAADSANTGAQKELLKNAAAKAGVEIAKDESVIRKQNQLSEADELAMFQYKNGIITQGNTLTSDQYEILVQQKTVLAASNQVQRDIDAGYADGTTQNQKDLAVHIKKLDIEQQQLQVLKDQAKVAETAAVVASAAKAHDKGGIVGGVDQGNMSLSHDEYGNPILLSGDPDNNTGVFGAETSDGSWGSVQGMGTNHFKTGLTGVGYGNQQLQDSDTAKNEQAFVDSEKVDLQNRITALENSDVKSNEDQVPALQAILAKLEQIHDGIVPKLAG